MSLTIDCHELRSVGEPLVRAQRTLDLDALAPGSAVVKVAGCGVCHTDLSFAFDGVRTRHPLPLTLGHEIAGVVEHAGPGAEALIGQAVVVPAVVPCGECAACRRGRGAVCPAQVFPGNDDHGGFASHTVVPARGLCPVDVARLSDVGLDLADLSVVADAVTTPWQALLNAGVGEGDFCVFIGAGGVGAFGIQLAKSLGAHVAAVDVAAERVTRALEAGAEIALPADDDPRAIKGALKQHCKEHGRPRSAWKIFETSGHPAGQSLAFTLLNHDAHLGVVGYTRDKIEVRLSTLMAFDATARGTWGCLPEHYPDVIERVLSGQVTLRPYIEQRPMSEINQVFDTLHHVGSLRRPVLVPDFAS